MKLRRAAVKISLGVVGAAAITTIGLSAATTASADATTARDVAYMATLDHFNVSYGSSDGAIKAGHLVCQLIDKNGATPTMIGWGLVRQEGWSVADAGHMVGASIAAYCPWDEGLVTGGGSTV